MSAWCRLIVIWMMCCGRVGMTGTTWKARRGMILWLGGMLWPWGWSICSGLSRLKSLSRRRNRRLSLLDRGAVRIGAGSGGAERLLELRPSTLGIRLLRAGPELAGY